jgi:hypothetical protein
MVAKGKVSTPEHAQGIAEAIEIEVARLAQLAAHIVRDAAGGEHEECWDADAAADVPDRRSDVRHPRLRCHQIDKRAAEPSPRGRLGHCHVNRKFETK